MIKFVATKEGRPMLGLGLSRGNCERLLEGKPIFIDLKVLLMRSECPPDMNDATILIFGGEDEESMQSELRQTIGALPKPRIDNQEN